MFYDRLKELCNKKGIKPSRVAIECGFSKGTVSHWKNDGTIPQRDLLIKIAAYFGVTVDYLLGKEETNKPTITEADIKVALFGGNDADADKKFEDVKRYIEFLNSKKD